MAHKKNAWPEGASRRCKVTSNISKGLTMTNGYLQLLAGRLGDRLWKQQRDYIDLEAKPI